VVECPTPESTSGVYQLGACNITCSQLLIDEGFVALDACNISSVPEFLHDGVLGSGRYRSVVLVSHLEGVREAADVVIPIDRAGIDSACVSVLQF